jgi:hypothetical protein
MDKFSSIQSIKSNLNEMYSNLSLELTMFCYKEYFKNRPIKKSLVSQVGHEKVLNALS